MRYDILCTMCEHPDIIHAERLVAGGRSQRSVALELGLSVSALRRHFFNGHAGILASRVAEERSRRLRGHAPSLPRPE
jgi:hypothetical protein